MIEYAAADHQKKFDYSLFYIQSHKIQSENSSEQVLAKAVPGMLAPAPGRRFIISTLCLFPKSFLFPIQKSWFVTNMEAVASAATVPSSSSAMAYVSMTFRVFFFTSPVR